MNAQTNDVAAVLERAAEVIVDNGWCQGTFSFDGCYCALGAIANACGIEGWKANFAEGMTGRAAQQLRDTIDRDAVDEWNDTEGRTQTEVVAALRRAATLARAGAA